MFAEHITGLKPWVIMINDSAGEEKQGQKHPHTVTRTPKVFHLIHVSKNETTGWFLTMWRYFSGSLIIV